MLDRYTSVGASEEDAARQIGHSSEFLLHCLLGARAEADFPSNEAGFDEDVNVYLVGLLGDFLSSQYHEDARRYLHSCDLDLSREVERAETDRQIFRLYKVNADHLLLAIGLFHHVEGAHRPHQPQLHREPEEFIGRGGIYYQLASSRLRRLRGVATTPEQVMTKLSANFARYVTVLQRVRTTYFQLTERVGEGTLFHLSNGEGLDDLPTLYDRFLDAFSAWKQSPDGESHEALVVAVTQLREADPEFVFELPAHDEIITVD